VRTTNVEERRGMMGVGGFQVVEIPE